jgi:hypothetical protein
MEIRSRTVVGEEVLGVIEEEEEGEEDGEEGEEEEDQEEDQEEEEEEAVMICRTVVVDR